MERLPVRADRVARHKQPITVALNNLSGNFSVDWNTVMAGALIAAVPTAGNMLLGRFFVRGLSAGSVK